jgi:hypothetical protein
MQAQRKGKPRGINPVEQKWVCPNPKAGGRQSHGVKGTAAILNEQGIFAGINYRYRNRNRNRKKR